MSNKPSSASEVAKEEEKDIQGNDGNHAVWLRILQINDVYELGNFPSFKTLVDEKSQGPDKTLIILAGDFLAPSLLSSLDKGRGMVDTMMACGITHVCFGNHVRLARFDLCLIRFLFNWMGSTHIK
jgi:2',3'-cyclic-nucleotide 2'-phosphodiesterase (5'-nucleotidase family)